MVIPKINSAHGSDTRNIINAAIDLINVHGKTIQDLVAEGQLTPKQYAELIFIIEGNLKSGDVDLNDLSNSLQKILNDFDVNLAVEKNRIDNLTKLTEGSTTGDAELIDGRIGSKGESYNNIGEAIRKQFSSVDDRLSFQEELKTFGEASMDSSFLGWESGTIAVSGINPGDPYHSDKRGRSIDFYIPQSHDVNITAKTGYEFIPYQYNTDGSFVRIMFNEHTKEWEVIPGFKYKFVVKKTDDSVLNNIPQDVLTFNVRLSNEVVRDSIKTGGYYSIDTNTFFTFTGWNAVLYPTTPFKKYEYSGITNVGGTPAVAFLNGDTVLSKVRLSTGKNIISIPNGTTHTAISVSDAEVNNVNLIELPEFSAEEVDNAFKSINNISMNQIYSLPNPGVAMFTGVKPSQDERDNKYSGLAFSDGTVWRWVNDSTLTISATGYATAKVSNGEIINSKNGDVVEQSASITKVLTSVVALDYITDLKEKVTVRASDIINSTAVPFVQSGDTVTYEDLLNSALIQSDNNAATALPRAIGYKINPNAEDDTQAKQEFFDKMEEKAVSLGMVNTSNFTMGWNSLRTTPNDLIKLGLDVVENYPTIISIWGKLSYEMVATDSTPRTWTIDSTTPSHSRRLIPEFTGGKTGSENYKATYIFTWEHKVTKELYLTAMLTSNAYNNERFINSRRLIDEVYSLD